MINSIIPIICLILGFYFGFRIGKEKEIPTINPVKIVKEEVEQAKEEKRSKKEKEILEQYIENLDNYPNNQKKIKE
jgi:uncharacterized protein YacL